MNSKSQIHAIQPITKHQSVNDRILAELTNISYLEKIKEILRDQYRFDVFQYRTPYFVRRISMISKKLGTSDLREIYLYIKGSRDAFIEFLNTLTIHVTEFFRDRSMWDYLRNNLFLNYWKEQDSQNFPPNNSKIYRIWSAGCSSGQEPYSLAIMMAEAYRKTLSSHGRFSKWNLAQIKELPFEIVATDVNQRILNRAKEGCYQQTTMKNADANIVHQYFNQTEKGFEICPEIKAKVKFHQHNLFQKPHHSHFDLIMCRNVVIYFTKAQQKILFEKFWNCLSPQGNLIIGKSELLPTESAKLFTLLELAEHVFQKNK